MKRSFLILIVALAFGFILPVTSFASTDSVHNYKKKYKEELSNLNQEEIHENFQRIDEEYDIGEEFSLKDQTFIKMYAKPVDSKVSVLKSKKISGSKTQNGVTVKVSGTIKDDIQN